MSKSKKRKKKNPVLTKPPEKGAWQQNISANVKRFRKGWTHHVKR